MSASGSDSFGVKPFRGEPVFAESLPDLLGAYARVREVLDALASWKPASDPRFGGARETTERASGRGVAAATVMRGIVACARSSAAQTGTLEAKASPIKRSRKDVEGCEDCNDPPGRAGWSNEKRSPKGNCADGGADRLSGSLKANLD